MWRWALHVLFMKEKRENTVTKERFEGKTQNIKIKLASGVSDCGNVGQRVEGRGGGSCLVPTALPVHTRNVPGRPAWQVSGLVFQVRPPPPIQIKLNRSEEKGQHPETQEQSVFSVSPAQRGSGADDTQDSR